MTSEPLRHFLHGSRNLFPAVWQQMFIQHNICILLHTSLACRIVPTGPCKCVSILRFTACPGDMFLLVLQFPRPLVEILAAVSHAPSAALEANAYLARLPAAAQSYVRTDARLEGVQEASSSQQHVTAGADLPLLGLEGAIAKVRSLHSLSCYWSLPWGALTSESLHLGRGVTEIALLTAAAWCRVRRVQ